MLVNYNDVDMYKLWLSLHITSAKRFDMLMSEYGCAQNVYENMSEIHAKNAKLITVKNLEAVRHESPLRLYERLYKPVFQNRIDVVFRDSEYYPHRLKECSDAPNVLFVRGTLPKPSRVCIGVVGTRGYTNYGAEMTDMLAYKLAKNNVVIVSGMAAGIDSIAASGAMRSSKTECATVAVLGSGVDVPAPAGNERLYERIIEHGAVISQFEPGIGATRYSFPIRNKVIAGLSDALIVTEAGEKSGALITAECAQKYGRKIFCVSGRATDKTFLGANSMLYSGKAKAVSSYHDILDSMGIEVCNDEQTIMQDAMTDTKNCSCSGKTHEKKTKARTVTKTEKIQKNAQLPLDENEQLIYNALLQGSKNFDELCEITALSVQILNYCLTTMEVSGIINQSPGRLYALN